MEISSEVAVDLESEELLKEREGERREKRGKRRQRSQKRERKERRRRGSGSGTRRCADPGQEEGFAAKQGGVQDPKGGGQSKEESKGRRDTREDGETEMRAPVG